MKRGAREERGILAGTGERRRRNPAATPPDENEAAKRAKTQRPNIHELTSEALQAAAGSHSSKRRLRMRALALSTVIRRLETQQQQTRAAN
jgi:hypothetical protein